MPQVVGISFKPVTKIYYFDPTSFKDLIIDDWVIVETARGLELGRVALPIRLVADNEIKGQLKPVLRRANPVDLLLAQEYQAKEPEALTICSKLVNEMNISMKVVQADYSFDGSRLLFCFTADQRIDFRELVKELAKHFKTRIEMKQVGARDETKVLDGYGRCGRRLCCSSWLTEFYPVSIRMAKQQGLPLAPSEISGMCGRLLCCLSYEDQMYTEIAKSLPQIGSPIKLKKGVGIVRGHNIINESVMVEVEDDTSYIEVPASEIELVIDEEILKEKLHQPKKTMPLEDEVEEEMEE